MTVSIGLWFYGALAKTQKSLVVPMRAKRGEQIAQGGMGVGAGGGVGLGRTVELEAAFSVHYAGAVKH